MITLLPYSDYNKTAQVLDDKHLSNQRKQVLDILTKVNPIHPATKMWNGYAGQLVKYGVAICFEWRRRGNKDTFLEKIEEHYDWDLKEPPWLGDERVHASHRANLIRKDPLHYLIKLKWKDDPKTPFYWPVK